VARLSSGVFRSSAEARRSCRPGIQIIGRYRPAPALAGRSQSPPRARLVRAPLSSSVPNRDKLAAWKRLLDGALERMSMVRFTSRGIGRCGSRCRALVRFRRACRAGQVRTFFPRRSGPTVTGRRREGIIAMDRPPLLGRHRRQMPQDVTAAAPAETRLRRLETSGMFSLLASSLYWSY